VIYARPEQQIFLMTMVAILIGLTILASACETAADGYYIRALNPKKQAQFIGIKTAAIRAGLIVTTMVLIFGATKVAAHYGAIDVESPGQDRFLHRLLTGPPRRGGDDDWLCTLQQADDSEDIAGSAGAPEGHASVCCRPHHQGILPPASCHRDRPDDPALPFRRGASWR
jgi:hypothetical protein